VRNQHDGDAFLRIKSGKDVHDFGAGPGVEVAGRFVGENQAGLPGQRAGNRHALLLAAGNLAGQGFVVFAQPHLR
jgi:hypothetical protein